MIRPGPELWCGVVGLVLLWGCLPWLCGCGDGAEPEPDPMIEAAIEAAVESAMESMPEPVLETGSTEPTPEPETGAVLSFEGAPEQGCEFASPVRAFGGDVWADIAAAGDGFVVVGVSRLGDGEHAFAVAVAADGGSRLITRRALADDAAAGHRRAAPVVAVRGNRAALAFVDGVGHLKTALLDVDGEGPLRFSPAADGASLQFAPVMVWRDSQLLLAWTDQSEGRRRVLATRINGQRVADPVDLTLSTGSACAPSFVAGAEEPSLFFVDAREAMSVLHRVDASGSAFGAASVARPISLLTDPPVASVFALREAEWVVYTGIGSAATTAVGLVSLTGSAPPVAVVPGTGYGALTLDVAMFGDGALIAAVAPAASDPTSREVHVRMVEANGALGEPVVVTGRHTASRVRVAVAGALVGLVFSDRDGAYVSVGRCAPP